MGGGLGQQRRKEDCGGLNTGSTVKRLISGFALRQGILNSDAAAHCMLRFKIAYFFLASLFCAAGKLL